jgi:hypothetical protein
MAEKLIRMSSMKADRELIALSRQRSAARQ